MNKQYFIALLPELNTDLQKVFEDIYKFKKNINFKLPFHLTIYFFGKNYLPEKNKIIKVINSLKDHRKITAINKGLNSFQDEKEYIYHLKIEGPEINQLNQNFSNFKTNDSFEFYPHITLFYARNLLNKSEEKFLADKLNKIKNIKFKGIYLGYVENEQTYIDKYLEFI